MIISWCLLLVGLFLLSTLAVGLFYHWARDKLVDKPSARSSHTLPTPRGAGVVIILGWLLTLGTLNYYQMLPNHYGWLALPVGLLGMLGFWDDYQGLPVKVRFMGQALICSLTLYLLNQSGGMVQAVTGLPIPTMVGFFIIVVSMMWLINLFNFMDGLDGLAAMQAMVIFGVGGTILLDAQALGLALLAWSLVSLVGGFLIWNWPPARIFMGDVGSCSLGFLIGLYAIVSYQSVRLPITIWIILSSPFWFDTTLTLLRRMLAKQRWSQPHRSHAYQRLTQLGWSHQKVLLGMGLINLALALIAIKVYQAPNFSSLGLSLMMLLLGSCYLMIERARPMLGAAT